MDEHQIKKALAPAQWETLKLALESECLDIKRVSSVSLQFESTSAHEATVRDMRTGLIASLRYDPNIPCVHYATPRRKNHFAFQVSPDGTMVQFVEDGASIMVQEISMRIIQYVLGQ
jgi:hypothetical protein